MSDTETESESEIETSVCTKEHCLYCFDVLNSHLTGEKFKKPTFPNKKYPLFVTWHKIYHGEEYLRGCIGNFNPMEVHQGLKRYALISALQDSRFDPISKKELPKLTCAVSLLYDFEEVDDIYDWEVGVHGIWIEFEDIDGEELTATYLPEVAEEQKWSKKKTIDSALRKGGYSGRKITEEYRQTIKLTRYKSDKKTVTYDEYMKYKEN
ncbi:DUF51 family protein [Neocallimastix lanati (nom. inval.)]|jgi:uncharacterized protein (TIGR00296 family)|nr:DUF51 family protein [Neocallimastix sp. JGI-2020a]